MVARKPSFRIIIGILSLITVLAGSNDLACATPFIETVDPPVLQRGAVTRVTLRGADLRQAVGVWTSLPTSPVSSSIISSSNLNEVTLDITVPADAPLGMHGLRLATQSGLSNVHLVLIDELPLTSAFSEIKVTGQLADQLTDVDLPCCVAAPCRPESVDRYGIHVATGQTVSFEVVGSRFGKNYDPLITVRDESGRIVAQRDNDPGLFYDCRFAHTFETSGRFIVEVRESRYEGNETWKYVLRMGDFPAAHVVIPSAVLPGVLPGESASFWLPEVSEERLALNITAPPRRRSFFQEVRSSSRGVATWIPLQTTSLTKHSLESEPNDDPDETATLATVPGTLHGIIDAPGDRDCFAFHMAKGQTLNFTGETREIGSAADIELVLYQSDGREVQRVDDASYLFKKQTVPLEARFTFAARTDGLHWLMIRELAGDGGPSFAYRIDIAEPQQTFTLTADVSRLTVPQNSWQPLPIKVTRERFSGPIELELIGAPAGVSLQPSVIPADVSEIVCRLVANGEAPLGISTLEIVGRWKSEDGMSHSEGIVSVHPMIDRQLIDKDRRLYSLRDNQLRLPPSLTSRFALMITPPAPFSIELPEELIVLTKYQTASFPIETQRLAGVAFDSPIVFQVTGGQIGVEEQERDNVFAHIPDATIDQPAVQGVFHNRINTQYEKARVDLSATAEFAGHEVTLFRTFELDLRSAFKPTFDPPTITVEPGGIATFKVLANRTPTYDGEVTVVPSLNVGLELPEKIIIPAGQPHVELSLPIPADRTPGRISIRCESTGNVGRYEEQLREPNLTIDVKKPK
ncbi:MAG: hypothetical protein HQ518_06605 [Rhodopirellula sp.]|nr:hypothetical protein [Rhodopirellula sp.]